MSEPIYSTGNSKIKELVKLRESPKHRRKLKHFVIEGYTDLKCIFDFGRKIEEIFFCKEFVEGAGLVKELEQIQKIGLPTTELSKAPFVKASYRRNSDGFLAVASTWPLNLETSVSENTKVSIVLDEVEKPGNLGAIIRTAEALGVNSILLSEPSVDYFNPNVVRSSRGLMGGINVGIGKKEEVHAILKQGNFMMVGTSGRSKVSYWDQEFKNKTAFVFGSEKSGLGDFWTEQLSAQVKVPMRGAADSLNLHASVACIMSEYNRRQFS
jgi:TrmH family RNA methyltransferase